MKKRILLIDESLTVQKVVALTLDKGMYQVLYARNRQEVINTVVDTAVDMILLSETVAGLPWQSFPKELESWLGKMLSPPPVVLITGQDIKEAKHYISILKKPFTPQALQDLVHGLVGEVEKTMEKDLTRILPAEDNLQATFNRAFSDEEELVRQTFLEGEGGASQESSISRLKNLSSRSSASEESVPITAAELWEGERSSSKERTVQRVPGGPKESTEELWGTHNSPIRSLPEDLNMMEQANPVLTSEESMAYKLALENEVKTKVQNQDLHRMVETALMELMPPIVERLIQERLDKLLKEHEESLAS